jgi:prepilin peptidase CpaA
MEYGISEYVLSAVLAVLLLRAAYTDWRARDIANGLNLTIALLAPLYWWASDISIWPDVGIQIATATGVFAVGTLFFYLGAMGGGDVKLLGALALWLPGLVMLRLAVIMSLAGGFLTLALLIHHKWMKAPGKPEIPYGLAISFGGLWVMCERNLNHFS